MVHAASSPVVDPIAALHAHFTAAVTLLRAFPPPGLDAAQRLTRALLLRELEAYADRGVFPRNRHFPGERRPTFVDENGVLCAVAHLLDLTGHGALALEVRDTHNAATVADLSGDTRFAAWARAAGFTLEELAVVQPAYCDIPRYACVCDGARPLGAGEALAVVASIGDEKSDMIEVREVIAARFALPLGEIVGTMSFVDPLMPKGVYLARVSYIEERGSLQITRLYRATDGESACRMWSSPALPLPRADLVRALLSAGPGACRDYLVGLDAKWRETGLDIDPEAARCGRSHLEQPIAFDTRGCTSSPAPAAESLSVLAALLTALAARRAYTRARPPSP